MLLDNIIKSEFQIDPDIHYLHHAGVSPWPVRAANAVKKFADGNVKSGSTGYLDWLKLETRLRTQITGLINAPSADDISSLITTS